jgi:hypothetical protein
MSIGYASSISISDRKELRPVPVGIVHFQTARASVKLVVVKNNHIHLRSHLHVKTMLIDLAIINNIDWICWIWQKNPTRYQLVLCVAKQRSVPTLLRMKEKIPAYLRPCLHIKTMLINLAIVKNFDQLCWIRQRKPFGTDFNWYINRYYHVVSITV